MTTLVIPSFTAKPKPLISLLEVTSKKFGSEGAKALDKYPQLLGASIHPEFYMKEVELMGFVPPPSEQKFNIHHVGRDDPIFTGVSGKKVIKLNDVVVYKPEGLKASFDALSAKNKLLIAGGAVAGIALVIALAS